MREAGMSGCLANLFGVLDDIAMLVRVLTAPAVPLSASTALRRLAAIQSALVLRHGDVEGRRWIEALDSALPHRGGTEWYESRVALGGQRGRRRAQSPTVEPDDLPGIVEAAHGTKRGLWAARNRALVAIACYSELAATEIQRLTWGDLRLEARHEVWTASVSRGGRPSRLVIVGLGASALVRLRLAGDRADPNDHVFANSRGQTLSASEIQRIIRSACAAGGFPLADRNRLLSAFAVYLSETGGLTEHEVAITLGVVDIRTIDRLLTPHRRLKAQRALQNACAGRRAS